MDRNAEEAAAMSVREIDSRRQALSEALARAVDDRLLLTHPFYRRWESGDLTLGELAAYATQYRAFEAALPVVLGRLVDRLRADGRTAAAEMVRRNLADELRAPKPHLELFDRFARALPSAGSDEVGPAARALVSTHEQLLDEGPVEALAALAAYETQASAIARTKGDGLRQWYGLEATGTEFWDVHAEMEAEHADWALDALALVGADPGDVAGAARRGADAWWAFLDERQVEAAA